VAIKTSTQKDQLNELLTEYLVAIKKNKQAAKSKKADSCFLLALLII